MQERRPILVGGGGERRTLRIAATYADAWHTWSDPQEFRRKNAVLDEHCATVGREPRELRRVTGAYVEDPADAAARVAAFHGSGADEFVLLDHRDGAAATTLDMVASCAP